MIDHIWTVVCSRAIIDKNTNQASMHDVLEQINIPKEPVKDGLLSLPFDVISFWARTKPSEPIKGNFRISFAFPSGDKKLFFEGIINLNDHERTRNIVRVENIPVSESGRYFIYVDQKEGKDWKNVAAIPIRIEFIPSDEKEEVK